MMEELREPAVAGSFYPGYAGELKEMIDRYLSIAKDTKLDGNLKALIIPHAGYIYSGPIAAYGYKLLEKSKDRNIKKVLILGPSHHAFFEGACESGFKFWETPLGNVKTYSIRENMESEDKKFLEIYPAAHVPEHCLEVQLPFLQLVMKNKFEVCPILTGQVEPEKLAEIIEKYIDERTLIIVSSDLSHYLPYENAKKIDSIANDSVPSIDIGRFEAQGDACGKTAILVLMHIAKNKKWNGKLLDYRNSGDTAGPKSGVVGYGCYAFYDLLIRPPSLKSDGIEVEEQNFCNSALPIETQCVSMDVMVDDSTMNMFVIEMSITTPLKQACFNRSSTSYTIVAKATMCPFTKR